MKFSYTVLRGGVVYPGLPISIKYMIGLRNGDHTYLFSSTSSYSFAMTFYYRPTVTEAFSSVQYIMTEANFGWLIRSVHRWSASMMVLMMILHVFRVYLTGGFKKPRELTWLTGVVLAVLTASFGVTGYSLPWDQIGYWAVKIVTGVPEAIPLIGSPLVELLRGSASVGQSTLTRFYSLHTFVLPLLTAVFMLMHFLMIRKQGISGPL
ncbi:Cytochrome b6 [Rhynchospora pubera]|uniref:Cytochrome b6 n=1 Tax=Rhynchospora pubera TaxID=906938 RepID=A0AAV8AXH1_9POAL|nr:Cytochrome b6 [Rhynchospora pubera]